MKTLCKLLKPVMTISIFMCAFWTTASAITLDFSDLNNPVQKTIYNVSRNNNFSITVIYGSNTLDTMFYKKKTNSYTVISKETFQADFLKSRADRTTKHFIMNSDAFEFTIVVSDGANSAEFKFIVYAKNYMSVIPTGGLAFTMFKNQYDYYYSPALPRNRNYFEPDSSYIYTLHKERICYNTNVYLGANYNYIINNWASLGVTTAFGYNLGATTTPVNGLLGANLAFGRRVKFNMGYGAVFMKLKTIPEPLQHDIKAKFSSPPGVPGGIEKWKNGQYFSFGVTLAILKDE